MKLQLDNRRRGGARASANRVVRQRAGEAGALTIEDRRGATVSQRRLRELLSAEQEPRRPLAAATSAAQREPDPETSSEDSGHSEDETALEREAQDIEVLAQQVPEQADAEELQVAVNEVHARGQSLLGRMRALGWRGVLRAVWNKFLAIMQWLSPIQDIVNGIALTIAGVAGAGSIASASALLGGLGAAFGLFAVLLGGYSAIRSGRQLDRLYQVDADLAVLNYALEKKYRQLQTSIQGTYAGAVAVVAGIGGALTGGAVLAGLGIGAAIIGAGLALYGWWRKTGAKGHRTLTLLKRAAQDEDGAVTTIRYLIDGYRMISNGVPQLGDEVIRREAGEENTRWIRLRAVGKMFGKGLGLQTDTGRFLELAVRHERLVMAEYIVQGVRAENATFVSIADALGLDPAEISRMEAADARKKVAGALG